MPSLQQKLKKELVAIVLGLSLLASAGTYLKEAEGIPAITLSPGGGSVGTTVSISGSGFTASATGTVWFDSNGNSIIDPGEPSASVTTSSTGTFTTSLTVPTVAAGMYNIRADVPSGGVVEASASFAVVQFIDIDAAIAAAGFAADFPFGIACGDPNFVYVAVHDQGLLAKIDINTRNVVAIINDPETSSLVQPQNFFGITRDPSTGNIFISEENNGKAWRFNPFAIPQTAWSPIPLVEQIVDVNPANGLNNVVYPPPGYTARPKAVQVNGVTQIIDVPAFGGAAFTSGNVWVGFSYSFNFAPLDELETGGDVGFFGLARVDPATLQVTRIRIANLPIGPQIPGLPSLPSGSQIGGLAVDSTDPSIIWLTADVPVGTDRVFKFNTLTGTADPPINLPTIDGQDPNPIGIDTSSTDVFVALHTLTGNDVIAQINKSTQAVSIINTGVPITFPGEGTFGVFVNNNLLVWTDLNFPPNIGIKDLSTGEIIVHETSTVTGNRFGCVPKDGEAWFSASGSAKVGILPNSKFSVGRPISAAGSCRSVTITNDPTLAGGCVIVDKTPPKMVKAFVTPSDYLCVETHDDVQTVRLTYNGKEIPRWAGSNGFFCTNEELPAVIKVVAEDAAGNKSEKVAINAQQILTTRTEQSFTAVLAKELNPHKNIEGVILTTNQPLKQIRLAKSPEFSDRELYISEKGIMELNGKQTVKVIYKGQYYGKERHGQLYVFATNKGKLATFDIVVKDDIKLYPHQEKQRHGTYDLDLRSTSVFDEMNLNAWQKEELERIFAGSGELTIVQQNILSMVLRLASK